MWVESTSSSGWEHFVCVRGLGFVSYVCQLCVVVLLLILIICMSMELIM